MSAQLASVYIHIPFCDVRCPYCHFYCFVNKDEALPLRLVRALRLEAAQVFASNDLKLESIYVGGGTPSALRDEALEEMHAFLREDLMPRLVDGGEVTVEMNPESIDATALDGWIQAGLNRLSIGIQSMDPKTLEFLGRLNTPASNRRALALATSRVENVSADLILATPGADWSTTSNSLEAIHSFPITHVSAYLLEIHRETRFGRDVEAKRWAPKPDDEQSDLYVKGAQWMREHGFAAYELSNFAQPGFESRHNRRYWRREPYFGLGPSAHSFHDERRWWNASDAARYCDALERGESAVEGQETLGPDERRNEEILLRLRTAEGIPLTWMKGAEGLLAGFVGAGLMERHGKQVRATVSGWLVLEELVAQIARSQALGANSE